MLLSGMRIEVRFSHGVVDAAGRGVAARVKRDLGLAVEVGTVEVYSVDKDLGGMEDKVARELLADPFTQEYAVGGFGIEGWAIEVGFLPGVTDNVGSTARVAIEELLGVRFAEGEGVYSSRMYLVRGDVGEDGIRRIAAILSNPLIQRVGWRKGGAIGLALPRVAIPPTDRVDEVDLEVGDEDLARIGREGIEGRGPLALGLEEIRAIREYFRSEGRRPTDVELESLAQTWSEHCKHTIFAARIDNVDSLYRTYIKGATERVRSMKGGRDFCLSVFSDNAGVMRFDDDWSVCYKVETHNSPSALDPYGGAITGIVGVNRDPLGTGKGSELVMNMYGFCFGDPFREGVLPTRDPEGRTPILHPRAIFEGVRKGVEDGGNKSGIPTPLGFIVFDDRYMGKPLVFVGTVGLMPARVRGEPGHAKGARPGDLVVMAGGRVGADGIHGATFSSEGLHQGSPMGAVQIGDPIKQKKLGDAEIEARDRGLYTSVTDCGAGGISCSVGEMARESGGCEVDLDAVPVKYPGLPPYAIWISESQERMTYAVDPGRAPEFLDLMRSRDVEATVIGTFTDSGRCVVRFRGRTVMDVDLGFLHDGVPRKTLRSAWKPAETRRIEARGRDLGADMVLMAGRLNVCSKEYVVRQYDHEVQGGSVIKPLAGVRQDVHNDAVVLRPVLGSVQGLALSCGILPWYGDIDTYGMAAACIDTAIRGAVAVGGDPDEVALLDNFCWCSSDEPGRLGQLERAARACRDMAIAYSAPFISGKDSMFNDFKGWDGGAPVKISVPPTLLVSSIAKVHDVRDCVDVQAMQPGDLVYLVGTTRDEMGASEYHGLLAGARAGSPGASGALPVVIPVDFMDGYRALHRAIRKGLVCSAASLGRGGLGIAICRTAMAGCLGVEADLDTFEVDDAAALFSESQGRLLVTVDPALGGAFEAEMAGTSVARIGAVAAHMRIVLRRSGATVVDVGVEDLRRAYRATLDW